VSIRLDILWCSGDSTHRRDGAKRLSSTGPELRARYPEGRLGTALTAANRTADAGAPRPVATPATLTIGTRGSLLALAQTTLIEAAIIAANPGVQVARERITTKGDLIIDRPLAAIDGKGLFVAEIEQALRDRRIDLAVHSAKDLPSDLPPDMALPVFPTRADPHDVLISRFGGLDELPRGARVGTSSPRRIAQLRALRPDLVLESMRGNVDTRLRKLDDGEFDAIVLAAAGLSRLGLSHRATYVFSPEEMLPSVGQGALALETRAADPDTWLMIASLNDAATKTAVIAERAFLALVGGGCSVPVAAYAEVHAGVCPNIRLQGFIGSIDGASVRASVTGPVDNPEALGRSLAESLLSEGGARLLGRPSAACGHERG
jgi:hydroxymethylbilane synthase